MPDGPRTLHAAPKPARRRCEPAHSDILLPDLLASMGTCLSSDAQPPAGPWKQTWNLHIPQTMPVARHRLHLRAHTADGRNFLALNIPVSFSHRWTTTSDNIGPPNHHDFDTDLSRAV
ncbi:hypothetical protein ACFCYB_26095 [Streptomyces sp. NPDC056309]|uniref:hypothetical protein n=1 Tax=unclassified Streptomyces TaxID=2593676 RepID=UPI0035D7B62E